MTHSQAPVWGPRERSSINVGDDIFGQVFPGRSGHVKVKFISFCLLLSFWLSQKTIGIINASEEPNWGSLMCRCSCSLLFVSCWPPAQGSLTEAESRQPVKFSTDTTVWQQLNYYDTSHNQRGCREYRHLFGTDGQGIAVNAQYSIQVGAITPNVWIEFGSFMVIWEGKTEDNCVTTAYLDTILSQNFTLIENLSTIEGYHLITHQSVYQLRLTKKTKH